MSLYLCRFTHSHAKLTGIEANSPESAAESFVFNRSTNVGSSLAVTVLDEDDKKHYIVLHVTAQPFRL